MWEASEKDLFADTSASAVASAGEPRRPPQPATSPAGLPPKDLDQDRTLGPQTLTSTAAGARRANLRVLIEAAKAKQAP